MKFKVGDKPTVTKNLIDHGFKIGEQIEIKESHNGYYSAAGDTGFVFFITDEEIESNLKTTMKQTLKQFVEEFNLRRRHTPSLRFLRLSNLKHFKIAKQLISN